MKKFITAIIVAIVVTACSQEEISQSILISDNIIYHASFEDIDIDSRTYLNSSQSLVWHDHDNISMFRSTLNEEYRFTGKTGDSEGDFAKVATDNTSIGSEISTNYAVYPYSAENAIDSDERISLVLPDVQNYAVDSFGQGANTMIATSEDKTSTLLPFRNIGGYIVVKLYSPQAQVKSIELRGNNSEILAGRASVQAKYGLYPLVTMDSGTECICLDCGGGVQVGTTAESATQFWFVVPPTSFDKGFTITITDVAGTVTTKTTLKRRVIERNKVMTMSAIEIAKTDADKMLPDYCDINTIDGWTNTRFCKNGMVVFTDNFEDTDDVRKSLMFIPLDNGEMVSMYAGYDENGSPQYLSFDDIVILIDNYTDTTFNATVVKGNQALWTATNLPLDNFQLDDENNTRAWHENNWVRNTVAIAGIVTSSIGVGIGVALTGTGVGAVAGIASIGFASASLAHNLNVLFGPGESYATNNYIIEKLQEIGQESLVDALAKDSDSYLAKIFKNSEWFDQNYKLPNLFWADLALGLVDNIWGKTVTESQRMQAYALAQRSYSVTTRGVQSLTLHTAELGGYISPEAISPLDQYADVDYGIVVYKADDPSVRQSKLDIIGNGGPFTLLFRGLEANTTYCYFVFYNDKTNYCFRQGETRTFYTGESDLREQLIQFYHSTGGDNWTRNDNWCSDRPLGEWYGISYEFRSYHYDNTGYHINLKDNNLTGYGSLHSSEIVTLDCDENQLISLDVSGCTALQWLWCRDNQLTSLDVSGCTALQCLWCDNNQLTSLDDSGLTTLEYLECGNNQLTSLDVSGCTALYNLGCENNQLTSLNVYGCTALQYLHCYNNQLTSLNVSGCTALRSLSCYDNQLTSLDVSSCTALKLLNCRSNKISQVIPEAFDKLIDFYHDPRYTHYYRDKYGVLHYTDKGVGWWYPGEPQKGYHGR